MNRYLIVISLVLSSCSSMGPENDYEVLKSYENKKLCANFVNHVQCYKVIKLKPVMR
jgi:hypothetical protein